MIDVWAGVALAALGVLVPVGAALYEFVVKGRKRLGYRVQMDTTAVDAAGAIEAAGALKQSQRDGHDLEDPTLVLLRVENNGFTNIDPHDYAVLDTDKVGLRVRFPGRRVAGVVVTELSHEFLRPAFAPGSGMAVHGDVIELPKVPLNRHAHYKVLAALERGDDHNGRLGVYDDPVVIGGIKGGVGGASTADLLGVVAAQPGAMGYSELGAATGRDHIAVVTIGESPATAAAADQGAYPFWETEYGYTYGEPPATSLAASFLRYLTNQVGADILRTHGNRPCGELQNPALCRPAVPPPAPQPSTPAATVPG